MSEASVPLRMAYADPPYLGCCGLYDHHHPEGGRPFDGRCWDDVATHLALVAWLSEEYPDGWALSGSAPSLRTLLPLCPDDVRVGVWCKTFSAFKKGVRPAYAWEPVIWRGGRNPGNGHPHAPPEKNGKQTTPKDFHEEWARSQPGLFAPITLKKGLTGAKPESFCEWVLNLLNARPGDVVDDVFPGTGIFTSVALTTVGGRR